MGFFLSVLAESEFCSFILIFFGLIYFFSELKSLFNKLTSFYSDVLS